jgi:hypothetical protein
MFCNNCGKQLNDNASFCPFCGINIANLSKNQSTDMGSYSTPKGKKHRKLIWIMVPIVVVILIIVIASSNSNHVDEDDITEYSYNFEGISYTIPTSYQVSTEEDDYVLFEREKDGEVSYLNMGVYTRDYSGDILDLDTANKIANKIFVLYGGSPFMFMGVTKVEQIENEHFTVAKVYVAGFCNIYLIYDGTDVFYVMLSNEDGSDDLTPVSTLEDYIKNIK